MALLVFIHLSNFSTIDVASIITGLRISEWGFSGVGYGSRKVLKRNTKGIENSVNDSGFVGLARIRAV